MPVPETSRPAKREDGGDGEEREGEAHARGASIVEILRRKDFALLDEDEVAEVTRLLAEVGRVRPRRTSRRLRPHARGQRPDLRLVRRSLRSGGEPVELPTRTRKVVPRKLVVLCDVSGLHGTVRPGLLLFLHATAQAGHVEAFAFGTRLHRLTSDLAARHLDAALARVPQHRRLGQRDADRRLLKQFNDEYGRQAPSAGRWS